MTPHQLEKAIRAARGEHVNLGRWERVERPEIGVVYDWVSLDGQWGQCWLNGDGEWAQEPRGETPVVLRWKGEQ